MPEDEPCLQIEMPRWALKHEFLLHGMFAMSALETAICAGPDMDEAESQTYIRAAMEYYDKGSGAFRAQLVDVSPENIHCVYMFSTMAMSINMALFQCVEYGEDFQHQETMLERVGVIFELVLGSSSIAVQHMDWLLDGPVSDVIVRAGMQLMPAVLHPMDEQTNAALERLMSIVDNEIYMSESGHVAMSPSGGLKGYQIAVMHLRMCFSVDTNSRMVGFCIAFPPLAGRDFTAGIKNSEPVTLFILLHWAVLLHRLGHFMWWAGSVGSTLVADISQTLETKHLQLAVTPDWRNGIEWACNQVGIQRQK
jgi:hypothetical protein